MLLFIQNAWLLSRMQLRSLVLSRRMLLCIVLAAAPVVIAWFAGAHEDAAEIVPLLGLFLILQVVAPLISLTVGSSVVTEEIESRTITYIFTRPTDRAAFFVGRLAASTLVSSILLGISSMGVVLVATYPRQGMANLKRVHHRRGAHEMVEIVRDLPDGSILGLLVAATVAAAMYTLISAGLGVFYKRAMILALAYTFAIEGFLANIPGSSQKLSIQFYLRSLLTSSQEVRTGFLSDIPILAKMLAKTTFYSAPQALGQLSLIYLVLLLVASLGIRRRQYLMTS